MSLVVILGLLAAAPGCATPQRRPVTSACLVGVSYNLELLNTRDAADLGTIIRQDFAHIARLGFDTVFLRHAEDHPEATAARVAEREGLQVGRAPRSVVYYIRTGRLPEGCKSVEALVADQVSPGRGGLVVLPGVVDAGTATRARQVAGVYHHHRYRPVVLARLADSSVEASPLRPEVTLTARTRDWGTESSAGSVMLLDCVQRGGESVPDAGARWLGHYHSGLAAGLTGGLIVEGFRLVPGRWRGLVEGNEPFGADRATVLRRIVSRARHWGPLLRRLTPGAIRPLSSASDALTVTLFCGPKRRFVMLHNTSDKRFIRGVVDLPGELGSRPVRRAVLVPPEPNAIAGKVVEPRTRRLSLWMDLRPGDAALWELF